MRGRTIILLCFLLLSVLIASCGSNGTQVRPRAPWEPELAEFFDDAADFILNPGDLQGAWATDYAGALLGRIDESDLICRVHITTINEDIAIDGHRRMHLLMRVTSTLHGRGPEDERLHLLVGEGSEGFDTVDRGQHRLFNNRFVAFVRWYENDEGVVRAHFHLSPASRQVVELVRRSITERHQVEPDDEDEDDEGDEDDA